MVTVMSPVGLKQGPEGGSCGVAAVVLFSPTRDVTPLYYIRKRLYKGVIPSDASPFTCLGPVLSYPLSFHRPTYSDAWDKVTTRGPINKPVPGKPKDCDGDFHIAIHKLDLGYEASANSGLKPLH